MADFEDSHSPTWEATIAGQVNLRDAISGTIDFTSPEGKHYTLDKQTATLLVRPRGWHLDEKHVLVDGEPISARIFDFGLYFFHNAQALIDKGTGPYFYLPKLESHLRGPAVERRLPHGPDGPRHSARHDQGHGAHRDHSGRVRDGRNPLRTARTHRRASTAAAGTTSSASSRSSATARTCVLPDRAQVTMTTHFLRSYSLLLIKTCHRRGAHAMGGMAAQIPIKNDPAANEPALAKVRADKEREATDGHDGTWVAHPGLVHVAMEVFDAAHVRPEPALPPPQGSARSPPPTCWPCPRGTITREGLRTNVDVGVAVSRSLAARQRLRADLQPDGRRRHGRDLPRPDLAVDPRSIAAALPTARRSRSSW